MRGGAFGSNAAMAGGVATRSPPRWARALILAAVAIVSFALLAYGAWLIQLQRAVRAAERGELAAAAEIYAATERPIAAPLARAFSDHYARVVFPQVALSFARGKTDEAIGKLEQAAEVAPALRERPEFGFWSGNVLLRRALDNDDPELIMKNLYAAGDHFRKALESAPDDWDLKYNYELVQYVLRQQEADRKKEEERVKNILDRIRTVTEPGEKEPPPPEKRG